MPGDIFFRWNIINILALTTFILLGIYSILSVGVGIHVFGPPQEIEIDEGRIIGGATGYTLLAYRFFMFPVILLFLSRKRIVKRIGLLLIICYIGIRMLDAWDRANIVSMLISVVIVITLHKRFFNS